MKKVPSGVVPMGMLGGGASPGAGVAWVRIWAATFSGVSVCPESALFHVLFRQERDLIRRMRPQPPSSD
jgi:hypothetical protein